MSRGRAIVALAWILAGSPGCLRFHEGPLPGAPAEATYVEIDGVRLRYEDTGGGPPVVLVHGFASHLDVWEPVVPALARQHRVIRLDLKGFGWSERPEGDYSPQAQAELVLGLMDHLGIERADLVGHSWGSSVVFALALREPERVKRIALYDAWVFEEQLPPSFLWARRNGLGEAIFATLYKQRPEDKLALAFYDPANLSQEHVEAVEDKLQRPGTVAAALAAVRGQRYENLQLRYGQIEHETLLLWGREDRVTTLRDGERLAAMLPHARMRVYPRCGHFPMVEARAASTRDLVEFLTEPESESESGSQSGAASESAPAPEVEFPQA